MDLCLLVYAHPFALLRGLTASPSPAAAGTEVCVHGLAPAGCGFGFGVHRAPMRTDNLQRPSQATQGCASRPTGWARAGTQQALLAATAARAPPGRRPCPKQVSGLQRFVGQDLAGSRAGMQLLTPCSTPLLTSLLLGQQTVRASPVPHCRTSKQRDHPPCCAVQAKGVRAQPWLLAASAVPGDSLPVSGDEQLLKEVSSGRGGPNPKLVRPGLTLGHPSFRFVGCSVENCYTAGSPGSPSATCSPARGGKAASKEGRQQASARWRPFWRRPHPPTTCQLSPPQ